MAPIQNLPYAFLARRHDDPPCSPDSHMTDTGCSGFEDSWPWTGTEEGTSTTSWYAPASATTTTSTWTGEGTGWYDPSNDNGNGGGSGEVGEGWYTGVQPVKSESDYKLAGVPVYAWIMLFAAIVLSTCVAFFFFARYLYRQDQAIKAAKAQEEEEEAAAAAAKEEPPSQPEKTPLMAQAEADVKALEITLSLPALWWAYGNLTARIDNHPKPVTFEDVVRSVRQP